MTGVGLLGTSARLLALLGLLQTRGSWSGADLASRLDVGERTLRKDVERLRELGYPVESVRGPAGGYRLGDHGRLPPLLLDDDEAVAVAVGLGAAAAVPGVEDPSRRAQLKLEQLLPARLARRVSALRESSEIGPSNTGTNVVAPQVDPALLAELAHAVRDHQGLRFFYGPDDETVEAVEADPYRLVSWQQRWYLVGRRAPDQCWQAFRVDWLRLRVPDGARFAPDPLDGADYAAFVLRDVAFRGWNVHARITIDAPAADVLARINPTVGVVETIDEQRSVLVTGGDSVETVAVWIGMLGLDFHVTEPAELIDHMRTLQHRYARALPT